MTNPKYYRPSGRLDPISLVWVGALGLPLSIALSTLYTYGLFNMNVKGWWTAFVTIGLGMGLGYGFAFVLRISRVRNRLVSHFLSIGIAISSIYFVWVSFSYALLGEAGESPSILSVLSPTTLLSVMSGMSRSGAYTINGFQASGPFIWLFWLIEALIILFATPIATARFMEDSAFCEKCKSWCKLNRGILATKRGLRADIIESLEAADFQYVASLPRFKNDMTEWLQFDAASCRCRSTNTLTVKHMEREGAKTTRVSDFFLSGLLLDAANFDRFLSTIKQPPPR